MVFSTIKYNFLVYFENMINNM